MQPNYTYVDPKYRGPDYTGPDKPVGSESGASSLISTGSSPLKEVSVISSDTGRGIIDNHIADHNSDMNYLKTAADNKRINAEVAQKGWETTARNLGGLTPEEASAMKIDTSNYDLNNGFYIPKYNSDPVANRYAAEEKAINDAFTSTNAQREASYNTLRQSIMDIYGTRKAKEEELNRARLASLSTMGIRQGTSRYAPEVASGILSAEERAGLDRINNLNAEEAKTLSAANSELTNKNYAAFTALRSDLRQIRDRKDKEYAALQTAATKEKTAQDLKLKTAKREGAISQLVQEGITKPDEIVKRLNFDETGKQVGDYTAKEVSDTLKLFAPTGDLTKLSGTVGDFFKLKGASQLPGNISKLPENQQMGAYLQYVKQRAPLTPKADRTHTITYTDATKRGWPLSTVGKSEQDIINDLYKQEIPDWFIEKANSENGQQLGPDELNSAWEDFRTNALAAQDNGA